MLRVTAILEGGLDLEKGEEIPRSIVVTNGQRTVTVPVPDSKVQELVDLFATELKVAIQDPQVPVPAVQESVPAVVVQHRPPRVLEARPMFGVEPDPPSMPVVDETGFEPGEDYDESGTGVSSL